MVLCLTKSLAKRGLTLLEMIIALAIIAVVFATILPQFRNIQNSWDSRRAGAEALQNGRVLIDHISRNLSKAVRITAVSDPTEINGYIEFEDNDGATYRYAVDAGDYVEYGPVGDLSDMAGPVGRLQFTCYSLDDMDTSITDVTEIRFVKVETTLTNTADLGEDKIFMGQAHIRANNSSSSGGIVVNGTEYEFDAVCAKAPVLSQIDSTHYLCAYTGSGDDGYAVVLTVDVDAGTITAGTDYEFEEDTGLEMSICRIDSTHHLCVYRGPDDDGHAIVLTVDTGTWIITGETSQLGVTYCESPALCQLDSTHFLCAYEGEDNDGFAAVLAVNTSDWSVTVGALLEFNGVHTEYPALVSIDSTHCLVTYLGPVNTGYAVVLTIDTEWKVTKETPAMFVSPATNLISTLCSIDAAHYTCVWESTGNKADARVLIVDTGDWSINKADAYEFSDTEAKYSSGTVSNPALAQVDEVTYLCVYKHKMEEGRATLLTVDTLDYSLTSDTSLVFDSASIAVTPDLCRIDEANYLCVYTGVDEDGYAVILNVEPPIRP